MNTAVSYGQGGMIEQPIKRNYIQGRGWTFTRTWIGPKTDALGLEQQLIAAYYDVSTQEDGPKAIVQATFGGRDDAAGNEVPEPQWERVVNSIEKSLTEHKVIAAIDDEDDRRMLKDYITNPGNYVNESPALTSSEAIEVFLYLENTAFNSFGVYQPVIRSTQTVSARFDRNITRSNIGKIISVVQMEENELAPVAVIDEEEVPEGLVGFARWGYLKVMPTITRAPGNKWQISTEYLGGLWNGLFYESASY